MIVCVDIDETLCHSPGDDYAHSVPAGTAIAKVNALYAEGHIIKLFTGRGSADGYDWRAFTEKQLVRWGVKYHELILGKPHADLFIDDKALNAADWLATNTDIKVVERAWGTEVWVVNCDEYCCKLLQLPKGAVSEYHYHPKKKETFLCLRGHVLLCLDGRDSILDPLSGPVTIQPGQKHSFRGNVDSLILETSTHHSEEDVVFLSEAYKP